MGAKTIDLERLARENGVAYGVPEARKTPKIRDYDECIVEPFKCGSELIILPTGSITSDNDPEFIRGKNENKINESQTAKTKDLHEDM